jgi:glycosyltransferase involved in cell wall biosynthesis
MTVRKPDVAVVILTLDEESNIVPAIESVQGWPSTVVVVDSGSSDETVPRAEGVGALVLRRCQAKGFIISEQRTWALHELARRGIGWVLFLDADERATPAFLESVGEAISSGSAEGYYAAPIFMYQGTWLRRFKGYPNWHPRVARTSARIEGGVWEDFAAGTRTGRISEPYLHYANSKGWTDWVQRHVRYAAWEARTPPADSHAERRPRLRILGRALGPWRPVAALTYSLVIRRGFLDGGSVWSYARRQLLYELMIVEARRELRRGEQDLPR